MGADKPKFSLPQATETDSATGVSTELGTQVTEKTSYSLQEGNAVTIPTKSRRKHKETDGANSSRASLLIEYFQGGAGSQLDSKPSVRVKVQRPSSKSRSRNDFVEITEGKTTRKPSYTKRIRLEAPKSPERDGDDHSLHSYRSATEESNVTSRGGGPIEIEVMPRRHGSPLIPTGESSSKFIQQGSDISSMPADSFLDNTRSTGGKDTQQTPRRSRSRSRERVVIQKVVDKVRDEKSERRRKHRSRSRSVSTEQIKSPRRRSYHESSLGAESSMLSSNISSGKSSSINNPKLLEMVETTIKRLILPELEALKRENSKHQHHRRSSLTSGSAISRDSRDDASSRRLSERESGTDISGRPRDGLHDSELISDNVDRSRKDKNIDRVKFEESPRSFERATSEDTVVQDDPVQKKGSGHRALKAAALGVGVGALTAAALKNHQSTDSLDEKKERRRRRTKSCSRSDSLAESYEERRQDVAPPMPMMSEINASEITRSSILSADTERPNSASQEAHVTPIHEVSRGFISPASRTPTRTPVALQQTLGTQHSNYPHDNFSPVSPLDEEQLRSHEYELDEHGRKIPFHDTPEDEYEDSLVEEDYNNGGGKSRALAAGAAGAIAGAGLAHALHNRHDSSEPDLPEEEDDFRYYQNNQEVPPPLRYVPYGAERRGLSPIQSVSGYTEGDPDPRLRDSRLTHSTGSYSSLGKSFRQGPSGRSMRSVDSLGNVHNPHDFAEVRQGGLTDSELTHDGEYWEEQVGDNDRNRGIGSASYHGSDPQMNYKRQTDGSEGSELDRVTTGQNVRGVGANPDYVHTPVAVESAVASLINESDLTGSGFSGNNGHFDRRGSFASFDGGEERGFTSRGNSPRKAGVVQRELSYEHSDRAKSSGQNSPEKYTEEYDLDEHGRKVPMSEQKSSHSSAKAGLAGIAAGAAAAVIAGRNKKKSADQIQFEEREEHTGAPLQKSFKDRAMEGHGRMPSPRHSVDALSHASSHDQLRMGASGLPDLSNPMPEIGYGDTDSEITNPSMIQGTAGGKQVEREHWSGHSTPSQARFVGTPTRDRKSDANLKAAEAALIGAAAAAGGAAALASHNRAHSHDNDEWQRSSGERKRDTLITNPYEGTSPIAAIGGGLDRDLLGESGYTGMHNNFSPTGFQTGRLASPKDEGYISSAPLNAHSPGVISPGRRPKGVGFLDQDLGDPADVLGSADPFYTPKHSRHLSGMSHGMESPVYDSATGNGIDRIQSKDIVALMDHLTVRDAQRSARDTEILVTLVQAAAEMRNSFEDMKRLLADTEDVIITEVQANTDKSVQKVINGPRPLPPSTARSIRQGSQDDMYEDIPTKRRNVFRRALKGLSMRSSNDLGKIEEMLVQLLGEVEGLKVAQGLKQESHHGESYEDLHQEGNYENDRGYEPEGHAGTSTASHASQSGHLSIPRGSSATRGFDGRKFSDHRISTVPEGDEDELDRHEQVLLDNQFENNDPLLTPTRDHIIPLATPPQEHLPPVAHNSNENTPKTDKSKRHKSSSSSGWIPKVSRWSETTASTVLRGFRSSGRGSGKKGEEHFEPPSRSGSDLGNYAEPDPYGNDRLRSGFSQEDVTRYQDNEALDTLPPPEDPKYKAHRDSMNLQHPQPRPGPTHRYQTALESQAADFASPMSPRSVEWGASQTSLTRLPPQQTNRYSHTTNNTNPETLSPVSDSFPNHGPARPPKEPLAPERPPKIRSGNGKLQKPSPLSKEHLEPEDGRFSAGYEQPASPQSPRSAPRSASGALGGVPTRKPTGPRSMGSVASRSGELLHKDSGSVRRNKNRDTFGTVASNHSGESETF